MPATCSASLIEALAHSYGFPVIDYGEVSVDAGRKFPAIWRVVAEVQADAHLGFLVLLHHLQVFSLYFVTVIKNEHTRALRGAFAMYVQQNFPSLFIDHF